MVKCPSCSFERPDSAGSCQKCNAPLFGVDPICGMHTFAASSVNQVLNGRYIIIRETTSNWMGVQYVAEDAQQDIFVTLRVLPTILTNDKEEADTLLRIAQKIIDLSHPNIVRMLSFSFEEKIKFLVTEYLNGGSLEDKISANGPLSVEKMLNIFFPVAKGLDYAHSQGVLHQDLQPKNIILSRKNLTKLANFSITKQIRDSMVRLTSGQFSSNSLFIAPEQFANRESWPKSDIYSLAACIYHCLSCDKLSWRGWMEYQILKENPSPLDRLSDKQNAGLLKSLSRNPKERHSSALELLSDLESTAYKVPIKVQEVQKKRKHGTELELLAQAQEKIKEESEKRVRAAEKAKAYSQTIEQLKTKIQESKKQSAEAIEGAQEQLRTQKQAKADAERQARAYAQTIAEVEEKIKVESQEKVRAAEQAKAYSQTIDQLKAKIQESKKQSAEAIERSQEQLQTQKQAKADAERQARAYAQTIAEVEEKIKVESQEKVRAADQAKAYSQTIEQLKAKIQESKKQSAEAIDQAQEQLRTQMHAKADAEMQVRAYTQTLSEIQDKIGIGEQARTKAEEEARNLRAQINKRGFGNQRLGIKAKVFMVICIAVALVIGTFFVSYKYFEPVLNVPKDTQAGQQTQLLAENQDSEIVVNMTETIGVGLSKQLQENQPKGLKETLEQAKTAQTVWREIKLLADRAQYHRAISDTEKFLSDFPSAQYAQEAESLLGLWENKVSTDEEVSNLLQKANAAIDSGELDIALGTLASVLELDPYNKQVKFIKTEIRALQKTSEIQQQFERLQEQAAAYEINNEWENAEKLYSTLLALNPDDLDITEKRNRCLFQLHLAKAQSAESSGDLEAAVSFYTKALSHNNDTSIQQKLESVELKLLRERSLTQQRNELKKWMNVGQEAEEKGDYGKAFEGYLKAVGLGNTQAMYKLGLAYLNGLGVSKNYSKATNWLLKAAEGGDSDAMFDLASLYHIKKDYHNAIKWFNLAAEAGESEAMYNLGVIYHNGDGVNKDDIKATEWFSKAADKQDTEAMYRLGLAYSNAIGTGRDYTKAAAWFTKAAEVEHPEAMLNLGVLYFEGYGLKKNYTTASELYRRAADKGNIDAMFNLGFMYHRGMGVDKDHVKAVQWYKRAAQKGQSAAMYNLGEAFHEGQGVLQDYQEAVKWYKKAAEAGETKSMFCLGWAYANKEGVSRDYSEAVKWYKRSAQAGESIAMYYLALMHERGTGVGKDHSQAVYWYQKAAALGYKPAKERLVKLGQIW